MNDNPPYHIKQFTPAHSITLSQIDLGQKTRKTGNCLAALFGMFRLQIFPFYRHGISSSVQYQAPEPVQAFPVRGREQEPAQAQRAGGKECSSTRRRDGRSALRSGR